MSDLQPVPAYGRAHLCSAETEALAERAYRYIQQQTP